MAMTRRQSDRTREAIKTTQLVRRVQQFALGEPDDKGNLFEMTGNQLRAALALINKNIPDLRAIELSGQVQQTVEHRSNEAINSRIGELLGSNADSSPATTH